MGVEIIIFCWIIIAGFAAVYQAIAKFRKEAQEEADEEAFQKEVAETKAAIIRRGGIFSITPPNNDALTITSRATDGLQEK